MQSIFKKKLLILTKIYNKRTLGIHEFSINSILIHIFKLFIKTLFTFTHIFEIFINIICSYFTLFGLLIALK